MKYPSSSDISSLLVPYYSADTKLLAEKIVTYVALLSKWNRKISLTTVAKPIEIVKFHFGESLFAASVLELRNGRLADVGSGAGFPGIPLAMAVPGLHATLIESNAKKAAFLSEVVRRLEISNVDVIRSRMEDVGEIEAFDFICARAVGQHAKVIRWARNNLKPKGRLVLFVSCEDAMEVSKEGDWNWGAPVKIPGSSRRCLIYGAAQ